MRQIINIHIGQAGVQMGESLWQTYEKQCHEQSLDIDQSVLYYESQSKINHPRAVFYDSDPMTIEQLQKNNKNIANSQLLKGKQSQATFSKASFRSKYVLNDFLNMIRKQVEKCDRVEGFMTHHSINGGTGSGFTAEMLEALSAQYEKILKYNFVIFPSKNISNCIIEPYNSVLSMRSLVDFSNLVFPISNEMLYGICRNKLDMESPNYSDINKIISKLSSHVTLPMCLNNATNGSSFTQLATNLIPYRRIHFISASHAPFLPQDAAYTEKISLQKLTETAFEGDNWFTELNLERGKFISNNIIYRGDIAHYDTIQSYKQTINKIKQVDWVKTGIKSTIISLPKASSLSIKTNQEVTLLANNTGISDIFVLMSQKFDLLYARRAFVHWYTEWAMQGNLSQARQFLSDLQKDYSQRETNNWYYEGEEQEQQF